MPPSTHCVAFSNVDFPSQCAVAHARQLSHVYCHSSLWCRAAACACLQSRKSPAIRPTVTATSFWQQQSVRARGYNLTGIGNYTTGTLATVQRTKMKSSSAYYYTPSPRKKRPPQGCSGAGTRETASPTFFRQGGRVPTPPLFWLKFVQKLVHCCNWLLTETQWKIISVQQN